MWILPNSKGRDWKTDRRGLRITVADNGKGMDTPTRERIFEPFFSTKDATSTGLGLWISREIVTKHEGTIRVRTRHQSVDAEGTTVFRLFLPSAA